MAYANPNIVASGTTFAQFQAGGLSGHLERLITANSAAEANPTSAGTLSASAGGSAGGLLPGGVYFANFTETNGYGETLPSTEPSSITVTVQAAPTGTPTVNVTGSGGTLPNGVYFGKITYVETALNYLGLHGETTAGTEFTFTQTTAAEPIITFADGGLPAYASGRNLYLTLAAGASGSEVLAFTGITTTTYTVATNPAVSAVVPPSVNTTTSIIPKFTAFPALQTGNSARNIYLTAAGGASGTEVLYARDQTGTTFTFSVAAPASNYAVHLPTINTTGFTAADFSHLRSVKDNNLQREYNRLAKLVRDFIQGSPMNHAAEVANLKRMHLLWSALATLSAELGTLVDANPGHINEVATGIGGVGYKRSWP